MILLLDVGFWFCVFDFPFRSNILILSVNITDTGLCELSIYQKNPRTILMCSLLIVQHYLKERAVEQLFATSHNGVFIVKLSLQSFWKTFNQSS